MGGSPLADIVGGAVVFQSGTALHFFGEEQCEKIIGLLHGGAVGGHRPIVGHIGYDRAVLGGERRRRQLLFLSIGNIQIEEQVIIQKKSVQRAVSG